MNVRFSLLFLFLSISLCGFSQSKFDKHVKDFLQLPEYKNSSVGIHVVDLNSGRTVYGLDSDRLLIPASTMKVITSASALEILGAEYRFETHLGYIGKMAENQTLKGDLVVIGGGDPVLGSEYFQDHYFNLHFLEVWASKIKDAGISKIEGNLILDGSIYDSEKIPATWIWEDMGNYYGAGANAFTVYDNLFRITFQSPRKAGKATRIISMYPKIEGLKIENEVVSADNNSDMAYVFGSPLDKTRTIRGTIPKNRKAFTIKAAIHQPEEVLAKELIEFLGKQGIFISGEIRFEKTDHKKFQDLYIQESPELHEIVKVLNHKSVNLFAEHLLKQISVVKKGIGSREEGVEVIKEFWETKGISSDFLFMEDGSGLSHFNAVSPSYFTNILSYMRSSENGMYFFNSLPVAEKGTLTGFSQELFPGNTLHAKSGSMTRTRCYTGYLKTNSNKTLGFSIMVNHFSGSHSKLIGELENLLSVFRELN